MTSVPVGRNDRARLLLLALAFTAAAGMLAVPSAAQDGPQPLRWEPEQGGHPNDLATPQSSFRLQGLADLAVVGMRGRGTLRHKLVNNGPVDYYFVFGGSAFDQLGTSTGTVQHFFAGPIWAGTPATEWLKHRDLVPSLANATGGGFNSIWNLNAWFLQIPNGWDAANDLLGRVHSGESATEDGNCTDFGTDRVGGGAPLGAASDCAVTWGSEQFSGATRLISLENWVRYFNDLGGGADFTFDWWRVPEEYRSNELLGDFQTYHKMVDWGTERMARFGNVMPGGTAATTTQGFPLGLSLQVDAFSFQLPTVSNVTFWQALIINESEQVYGVPLDYDSLYLGMKPGFLFTTQVPATYFRPDLGGLFYTQNGVNPACNGADVPPGVNGCRFGFNNSGFAQGAGAILVLNSPLGDLRNKLFSDPTSPFFSPSHPQVDDTITFNIGRQCGFGSCWGDTFNRSARAGFGKASGNNAAMLDGRDSQSSTPPTGLTATQYWRFFKNPAFPLRDDQRAFYVPGNWDWNNDGIQDTLHIDTCHVNGCVELWSDTMPGGQNNVGGNMGDFIGFGPIALAAGDTAKFTLALVTGATQAAFEANARTTVAFYQASFLRPRAPTPSRIVEVNTRLGDRGEGAAIQLFIDDAVEEFSDQFLLFQANQLEGTQLDIDNPFLVDSLRALADNNVARILIFKSCDAGTSWTDDGDCFGDPAVDTEGNPVGLGWQHFAVLEPDDDGNFANVFTDAAVTPGKTYLYTIVAETHGATFAVIQRDELGNPVAANLEVAPRLSNPLSATVSDPNVVSVYLPVSRQAGARPPEFALVTDDALVPAAWHPLSATITREIENDASYSLVFADSVVVERVQTAADAVTTTVNLYRTVVTSTDGVSTQRVAYDSASFVVTGLDGVSVSGGATTTGDDPATTEFIDTVTTVFADELTAVLLDGAGQPLLVTSTLTGAGATPGSFFSRSDYPGFIIDINNSRAGLLASVIWLQRVGNEFIEMRSAGTNAEPSIDWLSTLAISTGETFGEYQINWSDTEYGPARTFRLNLTNPSETQDAFTASLNARTDATRTDTSTAVRLAIADALGADPDTLDLLDVSLPFVVRNMTRGRDVIVAMLGPQKLGSITLGSGANALTVTVPSGRWVPGEALVFLENLSTFREAETTGGETYVVTDAAGQPVVGDTLLVTWSQTVLGCVDVRTCNPLTANTQGASTAAYLAVRAGDQIMRIRYFNPLTVESAYAFNIVGAISGPEITVVDNIDVREIKVVPNPYIVFSAYEQDVSSKRLLFVGLPPRGSISIFTVAGAFVQRIDYDEADLSGNGDLFWDMRTREDSEIASGLYVFVVEGTLPGSGRGIRKLGKFVVIR